MDGIVGWTRKTFMRGILLILPLAITFVILRWLFKLVTGLSTPAAERLLGALDRGAVDSRFISSLTPLIAVVITVGVVLLVGVVGSNYVGRRAWGSLEQLLLKVPLVRWFYGSARQLMDVFRSSGGSAFREVVLVEYPRRGIWCLGFITAPATGLRPALQDQEYVYVFLPTTPNPTSGYTIVVPRADALPLEMSVDEGLKLIFSGGFISPSSRPLPAAPGGVPPGP